LQVFNSQCAHCHGGNGQGGQLGPNILPRVAVSDRDWLRAFLREGKPQRGMPPAAVNRRQMAALIDHLHVLAAALDGSQASNSGANSSVASSALTERHAPDIDLPDGPGRALLETACTACHNLAGLAAYQGYWDRARWASMVDTMVEYGAALSASETETLVAYLAQYFGPGTRH
jgi:mono/diheme cytochrome c family protein